MKNASEFAAIFAKAYAAGLAAGNAVTPIPMLVQEHANPLNDASPVKKSWVVPDGVCGFAWVVIKPATTAFAKWLKATGKASAAYGGGLQVWVGEFNQSLTKKEAFAGAFARVLTDAGFKAYSQSRMD
jgi:hypothetical protein